MEPGESRDLLNEIPNLIEEARRQTSVAVNVGLHPTANATMTKVAMQMRGASLGGSAGGKFADEVDFVLAVGHVVLAEDFVEPDGWLREGVGASPGIPREVGLGFSGDEAPVDSGDVVALGDGQGVVEGAAGAACHVLRTEDGAAEGLELLDARLKLFWPAVVMEADDVGLG